MELREITSPADIKQGDTLIITADNGMVQQPVKAQIIEIGGRGDKMVIINEYLFFSMEAYLQGTSWVTEVKVVV